MNLINKKNTNTGRFINGHNLLLVGLVLVVWVGVFALTKTAQAQLGTCSNIPGTTLNAPNVLEKDCIAPTGVGGNWTPNGASGIPAIPSSPTATAGATTSTSSFEAKVKERECSILGLGGGTVMGCILQTSYAVFYVFPAFLLWLAAYFFNVLISISLSSDLFRQGFVSDAWRIVRDLSNMFFILILLYIAIKIILGLGGSEVKKMIAQVIIVALLINFSMFITGVVIDSANVLALIFYNQISVQRTNPVGTPVGTPVATYEDANGERDAAGGLTANFDPTSKLNDATFWQKAAYVRFNGRPVGTGEVPIGILFALIMVSGAVMLFAAYAFFVSGLSFVGRLIELWVLIIFSPFAFMSSSIPLFSNIEYLGWRAWLHRLLTVAFMAPIFMFFLYFIFKLVGSPGFFDSLLQPSTGMGFAYIAKTLLKIILPAMLILILLLKATEFAKKGSGAVGEKLMSYGKMAGGFALGVATGGAALAGGLALRGAASGTAAIARTGIGRAGAALADSEWARKRESQGKFGAATLRSMGRGLGSASFDIRGAKIGGKTLASATGLNVGEAGKGGFKEKRKEQVEKRQKRAKELEVGEDETLKQNLNKTEADLQSLLVENAQVIETLDKDIERKRQEVNDAEKKLNAARGTAGEGAARADLTTANGDLDFAKRNKKEFREGGGYMVTDIATGRTREEAGTGVNINVLEEQKRAQAQAIKTENAKRRQDYAAAIQKPGEEIKQWFLTGGQYSQEGAKEAAHDIIMEVKLDSGTKT